ncbi:MAG: hypothetical protein R6X05_07945 [Desulfobacterales bacterium]
MMVETAKNLLATLPVPPIEFWLVLQLLMDLLLVGLALYFVRNLRSDTHGSVSQKAAERLMGLLEPLLVEADKTARAFDAQLQEKNRLIQQISERLDSRIISLNLLLNRADACGCMDPTQTPHVYDQQQEIIALDRTGMDADGISSRLSLPRGEVDLVLDLHRKLLEVQQAPSHGQTPPAVGFREKRHDDSHPQPIS